MALSEDKIKKYIQRLLLSRMRILCNHGFYGLLLMHMIYSVDEEMETAGTDGVRITFGCKFLDEISDSELDFVMMHEIMHIALQHCLREGDFEHERFNIACDIVANSNILKENNMNLSSITIGKFGESMHTASDGKEGYEYTAEQVYHMLPQNQNKKSGNKSAKGKGPEKQGQSVKGADANGSGHNRAGAEQDGTGGNDTDGRWDDHSRWGSSEDNSVVRDIWIKRLEDAAQAIAIRDPSNDRGLLPEFAQRLLKDLREPQTDWRNILNEFIQEEIVDYSFFPPDRRFDDSPFFLPDFNEKDDTVENILFMIDTSGSMSDDMVTAAYSEIKGAIDQFDGKLKGWLGFFDAAVTEPKAFENEDEFRIIRPEGGGGTDFEVIFEYVHQHMQENLPASIIILTDGYAPFPKETVSEGIPVLWLINNKDAEPPWGKVARIKV